MVPLNSPAQEIIQHFFPILAHFLIGIRKADQTATFCMVGLRKFPKSKKIL